MQRVPAATVTREIPTVDVEPRGLGAGFVAATAAGVLATVLGALALVVGGVS
ncbi:hypothetical protein [Microbacterium gilvum]|uniref:Uncharacterized protein n=1 Tax=Microbacterium gilvum TaxID=1336204 RepID=A0ABP8ZPY0_9MICO